MKPYYGWLAIGLGAWIILLSAGIGLAQSNLLPSTGTKAPESPVTPVNGLQRAIQAVCAVTAYDSNGQPFSSGSAVIVASNMAVTCHHVVDGAAAITLKTYDGKMLQVMAYTPRDMPLPDLIILKISGQQVPPPISWNKNTSYQIGDRVYAIGNPQGLAGTVSDGIISACRFYLGYGNIIQTTAPISQGSSGGALVNPAGQLVGIMVLQMKEGQNLNFAMPIDTVVDCAISMAGYGDKYPSMNMPKYAWWTLPVPKSEE